MGLVWMDGFRYLAGELSGLPGDSVYADMQARFADAWPPIAGPAEAGFTKDVRSVAPFVPGRIDFWFQEQGATRAAATETWVVKTSRSDHHAVVIDVEVK